jgi:glycosyltransferase involved in cell wall biosynthesis
MRVVVLATVFPNPKQPTLGTFVRERMRRVAATCDIRVVAPIPWFPFNGLIRGAQWAGIPRTEQQDGLIVYHPRILCIPRYLKFTDGLLYGASLLPFLLRLRREFPFELIDAHFAYPDGLAAALLGAVLGRPVTITLRGSIVRLATYRLHRPQLRWALRRAAGVMAVSHSLKQAAVELGLPVDRVRVIPNGVDTDRFFPRDRGEARRMLRIAPGRPMLLSVGGLNEGKGHHLVLEQIPHLRRQYPDLLYVIVGGERPGDSSRSLIERSVARHGLQDAVMLPGARPHDEIPLWLSAANVFCLATRSEGWANVLLEALACGIPVVTTAVGGNPEIITSPALGTLVPYGDGPLLRAALLDALGRRWDAAALIAHARAHSWAVAGREVIEEFDRICPGRMVHELSESSVRPAVGEASCTHDS